MDDITIERGVQTLHNCERIFEISTLNMNPTFFHKSPQVQKSVVTKTKAHSDNVMAALKNAHQSAVHQSREQLEGILKEKQKRVAAADLEFEVENTKHAQVLAVRQCFHIT